MLMHGLGVTTRANVEYNSEHHYGTESGVPRNLAPSLESKYATNPTADVITFGCCCSRTCQ